MIQYLVEQFAYEVKEIGLYVDGPEWQDFFKVDPQLTQNFMHMVTSPKTENVVSDDPASVEGCGWHEHSSLREEPCKRWPDRVQGFQDER